MFTQENAKIFIQRGERIGIGRVNRLDARGISREYGRGFAREGEGIAPFFGDGHHAADWVAEVADHQGDLVARSGR